MFWELCVMACRAGGFYGGPFKAYRGVTQGGPLSPRIFNLMVDAVVREWLRIELGEEASRSGIGYELRSLLAAFYADDGLLASRDPVLLQRAMKSLVELFERVGLITNTKKTEAMTCLPGKIRVSLSQEAYRNRLEGHHGFRDSCLLYTSPSPRD